MYDIFRFIFGLIIYFIIIIASYIPILRYIITDSVLFNLNNYIFGFHKTIVKDYRKFKHDSKIIVFQHNSYYDFYALAQHFKSHSINCIVEKGMLNIPIMKTLFKNFECIIIDKKEKNNSEKVIEYINDPKKTRYIAIAPAGDKATREDRIGTFKTSAFVSMKPVTPVLIRYKDDKGSWFVIENIKDWFINIFRMRKFYTCELIILEEITAEGCSTPREYANKVEKYMKSYNK